MSREVQEWVILRRTRRVVEPDPRFDNTERRKKASMSGNHVSEPTIIVDLDDDDDVQVLSPRSFAQARSSASARRNRSLMDDPLELRLGPSRSQPPVQIVMERVQAGGTPSMHTGEEGLVGSLQGFPHTPASSARRVAKGPSVSVLSSTYPVVQDVQDGGLQAPANLQRVQTPNQDGPRDRERCPILTIDLTRPSSEDCVILTDHFQKRKRPHVSAGNEYSQKEPILNQREPKLRCAICMDTMKEETSTICGHIFCKECILGAIQAQKKCPTCRKKLNTGLTHRIYI